MGRGQGRPLWVFLEVKALEVQKWGRCAVTILAKHPPEPPVTDQAPYPTLQGPFPAGSISSRVIPTWTRPAVTKPQSQGCAEHT